MMNQAYRRYLEEGQRAGLRYELVSPRHAPWGLAGIQMANRSGSSLEFMDHREYQPGDDLRRIDWNAYARSDRLVVKLYREEVNPHVDIAMDTSRSMALEDSAKAAVALGLSAVFAQAALNTGYSHCAWSCGTVCERVVNSGDQPASWESIEFDYRGDPSESLLQMPPAWRPQGVRVLIGDLLWLGDPLATLSILSDKASAVFVVQTLARRDVDPPERGNIRLIDSESDDVREIFLDASAQQRYRNALAAHQQNWHRACRQVGAVMTTVVAEQIVENWNLDQLVELEILKVS